MSDQGGVIAYDAATMLYTITGTAMVNGYIRTIGGVVEDASTGEYFEGSSFINIEDAAVPTKAQSRSAKKNK